MRTGKRGGSQNVVLRVLEEWVWVRVGLSLWRWAGWCWWRGGAKKKTTFRLEDYAEEPHPLRSNDVTWQAGAS